MTATPTLPVLDAAVEALSDLLKYLDDHDWGLIPEGETADRARAYLAAQKNKGTTVDVMEAARRYESDRIPEAVVAGVRYYDDKSLRAAYRHGYDIAAAPAPPTGGGAELLPCPFCGGPATIQMVQVAEDAEAAWGQCTSCGARCEGTEDAYADRAGAIQEWNTRAVAPAPPADRVKRVVKWLRSMDTDPAMTTATAFRAVAGTLADAIERGDFDKEPDAQ